MWSYAARDRCWRTTSGRYCGRVLSIAGSSNAVYHGRHSRGQIGKYIFKLENKTLKTMIRVQIIRNKVDKLCRVDPHLCRKRELERLLYVRNASRWAAERRHSPSCAYSPKRKPGSATACAPRTNSATARIGCESFHGGIIAELFSSGLLLL